MSELGIPTDGGVSDTFATIPDVSVDAIANRVNPNQVTSGVTRGSQVVPGTDGKPQVLMGNQKTFGNGFFVAKPTFDVVTNTNPANLIFNSNQNAFKIARKGNSTLSISFADKTNASGTDSAVVTVAHNLGYVPACFVFDSDGSTYGSLWNNLFVSVNFATGVQQIMYGDVFVDATNITISLIRKYFADATHTAAGQTSTYLLTYYLLQETAS